MSITDPFDAQLPPPPRTSNPNDPNAPEMAKAAYLAQVTLPYFEQLRAIVAIVMIVLGWWSVSLEVFLRRDFGERYMSFIRLFMGFMIMGLSAGGFQLASLADSNPLSRAGGFLFFQFIYFGYMVAAIVHLVRIQLRNRQGVRWYSMSFGVSWLSFLPVKDWLLYRYIEPGLCFLVGLVISLVSGAAGTWVMIAAVALVIKNNIAYNQARAALLDSIDAEIAAQYLIAARQGAPKTETAGFSAVSLPVAIDRDRDGIPDSLQSSVADFARTVQETLQRSREALSPQGGRPGVTTQPEGFADTVGQTMGRPAESPPPAGAASEDAGQSRLPFLLQPEGRTSSLRTLASEPGRMLWVALAAVAALALLVWLVTRALGDVGGALSAAGIVPTVTLVATRIGAIGDAAVAGAAVPAPSVAGAASPSPTTQAAPPTVTPAPSATVPPTSAPPTVTAAPPTSVPATATPEVNLAAAAPLPSARLRVSTSSVAPSSQNACGDVTTYDPANMVDGRPDTTWRIPGDGVGSFVQLDLASPTIVTGVEVIPGYAKIDPCDGTDRFPQNRRVRRVELSFSDGTRVEGLMSDSPELQPIQFEPVRTEWIRVTVLETIPPSSSDPRDNTAISEVVVTGVPAS